MGKSLAYDGSEVILDDIPEITDFSKGRKNPFAGKFKDGYTVIVEHEDYNEIITVKKTRQAKSGNALDV